MEKADISPLQAIYYRKIADVDLTFKRYLYDQISWDARLVGIKGARGVGKTTMLLQHIKETYANLDEAIYVSLDNFWFQKNSLEDLVDYLYTHGITNIYLDEVHRYPNWQILLKNFYDSYPALKIVYTGSAILAIDHSVADLSRRQLLYTLNGLSFREYLEYQGVTKVEPVKFEDLLSNFSQITTELNSKINVLSHFDAYLEKGYYPFYKEKSIDYWERLSMVAQVVIEVDMPSSVDVTYATLKKIKKLLVYIAQSAPMEPNINTLASQLESTRDQTLKMLYLLDRAALISLLTTAPKDYKHQIGPKKIYLENPNLMYAMSQTVSRGTLRETFFINQVSAIAELTMPKKGDFCVNDTYLFEVGGPKKSFEQIADLPNSYLAKDGIEYGHRTTIPLWAFGLLY